MEAPTTKVHGLLSAIRQIRHASLNADFSNKLSTLLTRMVRNKTSEGFFLRQEVFYMASNRKAKGGKWSGPWIVAGRFVGEICTGSLFGIILGVGSGRYECN